MFYWLKDDFKLGSGEEAESYKQAKKGGCGVLMKTW